MSLDGGNKIDDSLSPGQKQYLSGFTAGIDAARAARGLPRLAQAVAKLTAGTPVTLTASAKASPAGLTGLECIHAEAQDRVLAAGGKLVNEEKAKRDKNPFAMWDEMLANAEKGVFPKGTDVFLYKYHGMFHVAPAQDSFMCRLRFAGGIVSAAQFRGVADLAHRYGGGYTHVTTRANLQIREIGPRDPIHVINGQLDLGVINKGAGADNIRNVTASPTAGIDPHELIDTRDLARQMHHYILNHREMYGLPRKFNIAFDGGGRVSALADTNDIGFMAVHIDEAAAQAHNLPDAAPGVYFRMELGGITGHKNFSRDTGLLLTPAQCIPAAAAVVKAFSIHGDRTDRKKARLKYVLDRMGFEAFVAESVRHMPFTPLRLPLEACRIRGPVDPAGHLGVHEQKQPGKRYIGVATPVGKLTCEQMRRLADLADRYGTGVIRLTVWQNLLLSDIDERDVAAVCQAIDDIGLAWRVTNLRAGLVACTGNGGCKFAASNTKAHALALAEYLEARVELDQPINIHLTGCHHSCAQHYIGDIGLIATKVARGEDMLEGYHVFLGGGYGEKQHIAAEFQRDVTADELPAVLEQLLLTYLRHREAGESFHAFAHRLGPAAIRQHIDALPLAATA